MPSSSLPPRPRFPCSRRLATRVISARGTETVFFRYAVRKKMQTTMTARLTREVRITVIKIWRLASAEEMPAKMRPLTAPAASRVGT